MRKFFSILTTAALLIWLFNVNGHYLQVKAQVLTSPFKIVDSSDSGNVYAYGPAIIRQNGNYHVFFCSRGEAAWDYIRYTKSTDGGKTWTTPVIVLKAFPHNGKDLAACDPSVVFYNNYYYLYYSSAYNSAYSSGGNSPQTVIQVARSTNIGGPYATFSEDGTWKVDSPNAKIIIYPFVIRSTSPHGYGAGQQTVIAKDGKLIMWYYDDSVTLKGSAYKVESTNPVVWKPSQSNKTYPGLSSADIKYDPVRNGYVLLRVKNNHLSSASLQALFSTDGISWLTGKELLSSDVFPNGGNNVGFGSDRNGFMLPDASIIGFGAPYDLGPDIWGYWDLYGIKANLNNVIFEPFIRVQGDLTDVDDIDGDEVNETDFLLFKSQFGQTSTTSATLVSDIDSNGIVNIFDYNILVKNFDF